MLLFSMVAERPLPHFSSFSANAIGIGMLKILDLSMIARANTSSAGDTDRLPSLLLLSLLRLELFWLLSE